eukprot:364667-Chlamydomonas_euryale.AAC.10
MPASVGEAPYTPKARRRAHTRRPTREGRRRSRAATARAHTGLPRLSARRRLCTACVLVGCLPKQRSIFARWRRQKARLVPTAVSALDISPVLRGEVLDHPRCRNHGCPACRPAAAAARAYCVGKAGGDRRRVPPAGSPPVAGPASRCVALAAVCALLRSRPAVGPAK